MKLIKRTPETSTGLDSMLDHFFNDSFLSWPASPLTKRWSNQPAYNIKEEEDNWQIELAAPGMAKDDFKIDLEHDMLTIATTKTESKQEETDNYKIRQFGQISFSKSFRLPENMVVEEDIKATYHDGILYVTLPKREDAKTSVRREITVG